jgi:membrane protein YdbS with pleckstrin-like domain
VNTLHPRVVIVWRLANCVAALVLTAAVGLLEGLMLRPVGVVFIAPGLLTGLTAVFFFSLALFWPQLRYRYWRWGLESDRVLIQKGVVWRSRSLIPRVRIQHVDTHSSPLQRWLGLNSLVIYTAGTRGADAEIPGLVADEAERLRDELARLEELDDRA